MNHTRLVSLQEAYRGWLPCCPKDWYLCVKISMCAFILEIIIFICKIHQDLSDLFNHECTGNSVPTNTFFSLGGCKGNTSSFKNKGSNAHILLPITTKVTEKSSWKVFYSLNSWNGIIYVWSKYVGRHGDLNEITLREMPLSIEPFLDKIRSKRDLKWM